MSKKGVGIVIGRAVVDKSYRKLLKSHPHAAFEGYELTGEEQQALAGIDHHALDKLSDSVETRLRHWFVGWAVEG
ncbi:MAG: Os1348 family NHLP clan protein [Thermoleophilia bacterium]